MPDINDLKRRRKAAADDMAARADALAVLEANSEATAEQLTAAQGEFATAQAAFTAADAAVKRQEAVDAALAASAVTEAGAPAPVSASVPAQAADPATRGADLGLMVAAVLAHPHNRAGAVAQLDAAGHSAISAALSGATEAAGGVLVPRPMANTIIELLHPRVAVRRLPGVRVVDMPAGQLRNARVATAPVASYGAVNFAAAASEPTFDKVDMAFKSLKALVPVGNTLLRTSSLGVGVVVRDLLIDALALKQDVSFLRSPGTNDEPKGLRHFAPVAHWQAGVANTYAAVIAAVRSAVNKVEESNVVLTGGAWIMRPAARNFLATLRNPDTGFLAFPAIDQGNTLEGYPILTTTQIPANLGAGTNETEVYFVAGNEIMIGDSMQITVAASTEAAYVNGDGDTVSAFQNSLTLMRAEAEHDMAPMHDQAIAGFNGVAWTI